MKLGLSSFTFGWAVGVPGHVPADPLDEHGLLDACQELGAPLLQIGDNLPLRAFDDARLGRLADRAAREGVRIEVGGRGLTLERVAQYSTIARRLGSNLLRMVIDEGAYQPDSRTVAGILRESIPLLDGLVLGLENHDRFKAKVLRSIVQSAGSDRIGVCLDTANSLGAGEGIEAVASLLAPLTVNLHIKDFAIERVPHLMGFQVGGRPAGGGMLDVPGILRQVAAAGGRCATAVLELWTPPEASLAATLEKERDWAKRSFAYLRPLFEREFGGAA